MQCPICSVELVMSERQAIEIDYCPKCRGVWLDRGELDKIIEKSAAIQPMAPQIQPVTQGGHHGHNYDDDYRKHKRKSFLHELFD